MKFETGKLYHILFLDHSIGLDDDLTCEVFGRVIKQDSRYIYLAWWDLPYASKKTREDNQETAKIVKSSILRRKIIPSF